MNSILSDYFKELTSLQNESENRKQQADRYMKEALQLRSLALSDINNYQLHAEFIYGRSILYPKLDQEVIICDTRYKQITTIEHLLTKFNRYRVACEEKILIYAGTTKRCQFIVAYLQQCGKDITQLNSETTPMDARAILRNQNQSNNIIAISSELDNYQLYVEKVKYIINVDAPSSVNTYIDRIIINADKSKYIKVVTLLDKSSELFNFHEKYLRELLNNTECDNEMITSDEYTKARRMLSFSDISESDSN